MNQLHICDHWSGRASPARQSATRLEAMGTLRNAAEGRYVLMSSQGPVPSLHGEETEGTLWIFWWDGDRSVRPACVSLQTDDDVSTWWWVPPPADEAWNPVARDRFEADAQQFEGGEVVQPFRLGTPQEIRDFIHAELRAGAKSAH